MLTNILYTLLLATLLTNSSSLFAAADDSDELNEQEESLPKLNIVRTTRDRVRLGTRLIASEQDELTLEEANLNIEVHQDLSSAFKIRAKIKNDIKNLKRMIAIIKQIRNFEYFSDILRAIAENNRIDVLNEIIRDTEINSDFLFEMDSDGNTLLHYAAYYNSLEVLNFSLSGGANPDIQNRLHFNLPLHIAAANGSLEIVQRLIEAAPDTINATNGMNLTALDLATRNGHRDLVRYLRSQMSHGVVKSIMSFFSSSSHS